MSSRTLSQLSKNLVAVNAATAIGVFLIETHQERQERSQI